MQAKLLALFVLGSMDVHERSFDQSGAEALMKKLKDDPLMQKNIPAGIIDGSVDFNQFYGKSLEASIAEATPDQFQRPVLLLLETWNESHDWARDCLGTERTREDFELIIGGGLDMHPMDIEEKFNEETSLYQFEQARLTDMVNAMWRAYNVQP